MCTMVLKILMVLMVSFVVTDAMEESSSSLQPTPPHRSLRDQFEPNWVRKIFEPAKCDTTCIAEVISQAKEAVIPSVAQEHPSFSFTMIVRESGESYSNSGIMKFIFTVITNTFYQTLNIVLPNIRVMVEDRWLELRTKASTILDKYVPGGTLAVRRTSLLDDLRDDASKRSKPYVEEFCASIPEVTLLGTNFPLDRWCIAGVMHLFRGSIMYIQNVIEKLLDMAVEKTSSMRGKLKQAASFVRHLLVKPVGELVAEVSERQEEITDKVDKTIESVLNMELEKTHRDKSRTEIEELLREKNVLKAATCETGDFMCPVDQSVMISTIVLDKVMIWSELVDAFEAPMTTLLGGISHAVFRDEEGGSGGEKSAKKWHGGRCHHGHECHSGLCVFKTCL